MRAHAPWAVAWAVTLLAALAAGCGREENSGATGSPQSPSGPPSVVDIRIVPTPAYVTSILTAQAHAADPQAQLVELLYQWIRNGTEIPGAAGQALRPPAFKRGDQLAVRVTPRAGGVQGSAVTSAPITIMNSPPLIVRLTVTPVSPSREDSLKVTVEARDPDADRLLFKYQWLRNGNEIPDGVGPTLAAGHLRKGDRISVRVSASDSEAETGPVESPPVVVRNAPPRFLAGSPWRNEPDGSFSCQVAALDADGDPLTFALSSDAPKGMTIDPKTGTLRWHPQSEDVGTYRFTVAVNDGDGGIVRREFSTVVAER